MSGADAHAAGRAALIAALGAGLAWGLVSWAWNGVSRRPFAPTLARLGSWLLALLAVGSARRRCPAAGRPRRAAAVARVRAPDRTGRKPPAGGGEHELAPADGSRQPLRLLAHSLGACGANIRSLGVGAGNYARPYFRRRATTEDIDQPHSVELQVLSELGLVGLLLLACLIGGVAWGAVRARRRIRGSELRLAIATCGIGMFTAWLLQASVDWMHLLPGLTAIALAGAAVLLWPRASPGGERSPQCPPPSRVRARRSRPDGGPDGGRSWRPASRRSSRR